MKVLVIGASGLVGRACYNYFSDLGHQVIGTHNGYKLKNTIYFNALELDQLVNNEVFNKEFDLIIHTAALTNVDYCEKNEDQSYQNNVIVTQNIIKIAKSCQAKLCFTSTDYVFDGESGPYTEDDRTNPINVYGKHKLDCESMISKEMDNYLICRITNVYGDEARNKNFVSRMINNNLSNSHLELPLDQYATPINAADVARAIFCLVANDKNGIYHLASTDYMNRYQLANRVIEKGGLKLTTGANETTNLKQAARRPLNGGLLSHKFLSEFPDFNYSNIDDYLEQKKRK